LANKKYFCCFICVVVGLTTVYKLKKFFTVIFAVLLNKKLLFVVFRNILFYREVWIAVSTFNNTIECDNIIALVSLHYTYFNPFKSKSCEVTISWYLPPKYLPKGRETDYIGLCGFINMTPILN